MGSTYGWTAGSGRWGDGANWIGQGNPKLPTMPGATDTATIVGPSAGIDIIAGGGSAADLTLTNAVAFAGIFAIGTLTTGGAFGARTAVLAGSVVTAANSSLQGTIQIGGPGAVLNAGSVVLDGVLDVRDHAMFDASALTGATNPDTVVLDATATVEIGGGGIATAGTLAVDAGVTLSMAGGAIDAPILDQGTIATVAALTLAGPVTGNGRIVLAAPSASLTLYGAVGSGMTIDFSAAGGVLVLPAVAVGATIAGFAPGDQIEILVAGVDGAAYTATGGGFGTLALTAHGTIVETLTLAGDFSAQHFLVLPALAVSGAPGGVTATLVLATNAPQTSVVAIVSPGTDPFTWSLTDGGSWDDPTNWTPGGAVPGADNPVTLVTVGGDPYGSYDPIDIVNGNGDSASLTIDGPVALNGAFATGALTVAPAPNSIAGALDLLPGTSLAAVSATVDTLLVDGAALSVSGTLAIGDGLGDSPSLAVVDGGRVTAGALDVAALVTVDAKSAIEVGSGGHAVSGAIAIDAGAVLSFGGNGALDAPVVDDGTISIADGLYVGSVVELNGAVTGTGTVQIGSYDDLLLTASVAHTQTIAFVGADATLDLSDSGFLTSQVTGLAVTNGFVVGAGVTGVGFAPTGSAAGTLTFFGARGSTVQRFVVSGALAGNAFVLESTLDANAAVPVGGQNVATSEVRLVAGTLQAGAAPAPAAGTTDGESFTWAGNGGAWGAAANWGTVAAPGRLDSVTFDYGTPQAGIVSGAGNAATVAVYVPVVLSGTFDFGSLTIDDGRLDIPAGATLNAGQVNGGFLGVTGSGASLNVSGVVDVGLGSYGAVFAVTDGGHARVGQLGLDIPAGETPYNVLVAVDASSVLEIGTVGGAAAGAMTVDAGQVVSGRADWDFRAALHNAGRIFTVDTGLIEGSVDGSGILVIGQDATLTIDGSVAATQTIDFAGADATLVLAEPIAATIVGFAAGDTIELTGAASEASFSATGTGMGRLAVGNGGRRLASFSLVGDFSAAQFVTEAIASTGMSAVVIAACFAEGTRIATEQGEVAIERLRVGDRVRTRGALQSIEWIGRRRVDRRRHPRPEDVWPVRIDAHAFGPGRPKRTLFLSPDHAVHIDDCGGPDVLIPVRYLLNDATIRQVAVDHVTYWHVELPRHDVVLAEGLACESYLDTGNRAAFENGGPAVALHPDFARAVWAEQACAELVLAGPALVEVRTRLLARAETLGHVATDDAGFEVRADGRTLTSEPGHDGTLRFDLPARAQKVELRSRASVPAYVRADATDHRRLGVAVAELTLDGEPLTPDDSRFGGGWHAPEPEWRWTDGAATLATGRATRLSLKLLPLLTYWADVRPGSAPALPPTPARPEKRSPAPRRAGRGGRAARL